MTTTKQKPRPVLRYHGGKWLLAPWIISHFPEHTTYVEPYAGGASVLLRKPRSYAEIINDLDGEIVNVFRVLRDQGGTLAYDLKRTPFAREEFLAAYEPTDDPLERARRTIIKSAMGYGSDGIRNNTGFRSYARKERYTIPAHDWANYIKVINHTIERLQGVVIESRPALELIAKQDGPDTLFYVDPPYVHSSRASKNPKRYNFEMSDADHIHLANCLKRVKGKVVLSGYDSPLYHRLYKKGWRVVRRPALADGARERTEVLWLNFKA